MIGSEYELLYKISVEGLAGLDGIAKSQGQIDLETVHSAAALRQFEGMLRGLTSGGLSYTAAVKQMTEATTAYGGVARDVLANEAAMRRSMEESERAATKLADAERRAALERQNGARRVEEAIRRTELANQRASERAAALAVRQQQQAVSGVARGMGLPGAFALGSGSMAVAGAAGIAIGLRGVFDMVKDAAEGARTLQNLADELGISASQAFRFQAAARLAGVEIGTMSQAIRRLASASEDPSGTGKEVLKVLTDLGVSTHQSPGDMLIQVADQLNKIHNVSVHATYEAILFGRSWTGLDRAVGELKNVHQELKAGVQDELLNAQYALADFGNSWVIAAGTGVAALQKLQDSVSSVMRLTAVPVQVVLSVLGVDTGLGKPVGPTVGPFPTPGDPRALLRTLGESKEGLDDRAAEAKEKYDKALAIARADAQLAQQKSKGAPTQAILDAEREAVISTRKEYERLEAAKKAAAHAGTLAESWTGVMDRMTERAAAIISGERGPLGSLDAEYRETLKKYGVQPFTAKWEDYTAKYGLIRDSLLGAQGQRPAMTALQQRELLGRISGDSMLENAKFFGGALNTGMRVGDPLYDAIFGTLPNPFTTKRESEFDRQSAQLNIQYQTSTAQRQASAELALSPDKSPTQSYRVAIDLANQELAIRQRDIAFEDDADKRAMAAKRALYEYMEQEDEAHLKRMEAVKALDDQQKKEAASLFTGWFDAAISHRPSAVTTYLSGYGHKIVDQIIGNVSENTVGSLQGLVGLGRTGALGTPDQRTWLGKFVKGTPLDFSAKEYAAPATGKSPIQGNTDATGLNTDATNKLTTAMIAVLQMAGVDTSSLTKAPGGGYTTSSLANALVSPAHAAVDLAHAIQSHDPAAIVNAARHATVSLASSPMFRRPSGFAGGNTANFPLPNLPFSLPPDFSMPSGRGVTGTPDLDSFLAGTLPSAPAFSPNLSPSGFPTFGDIASLSPSGLTMPNLGSGASGSPDLDSFLGEGLPGAPSFPGSFSVPSGSFPAPPDLSGASPSTLNVPYAAGGTGLPGALSLPMSGLPNLGTPYSPGIKVAPAANNPAEIISAFQKFAGGGGMGGAGSGITPGDIWDKIAHPERTNITTPEAVMGGIAMGAQIAGGTLQAITGFNKGGARGDISGIGGALTAASVIPGPQQPFVMAGATIMDLVSSLFPDPRQERIKQEQETLLQQAFIQPARHDYSFASSGGMGAGGGFAMSEGGAAGASGAVTNNHYWQVSAMDAKSFVQFMQDNPTAAESVVSTGITSGSQAALGSALTYVAQNGGW